VITSLSRAEFLDEFWDYRPGEHVAFIEPTTQGKTHLAYQCLERAMRQHPQLSIVSLMPKPKDPATVAWAQRLNLRETPVWPPQKKVWDVFESSKPDGWVCWPKHAQNLDPEQRHELIAEQLKKAVDQQYWSGDSITFADDTHSAAVLMGLNPYFEEVLVNGGAGGAAFWGALQKPSGTVGTGSVSSFIYSATTHLFLGKDRDERNIQRFGEIGGVDPRLVQSVVRDLRMFSIDGHSISEKLYIDKRGPYMALIGP
jgi:hypothetical protein